MSKKRIDIPDDLTQRMVGPTVTYQTPSVYPPVLPPVQQFVAEVAVPRNVGGRPVKAASAGRVKYTTAISKDLIRFLRVEAAQRDMTPADLLEIIISEYQGNGENR